VRSARVTWEMRNVLSQPPLFGVLSLLPCISSHLFRLLSLLEFNE